jgi:hypothetical protein
MERERLVELAAMTIQGDLRFDALVAADPPPALSAMHLHEVSRHLDLTVWRYDLRAFRALDRLDALEDRSPGGVSLARSLFLVHPMAPGFRPNHMNDENVAGLETIVGPVRQ